MVNKMIKSKLKEEHLLMLLSESALKKYGTILMISSGMIYSKKGL